MCSAVALRLVHCVRDVRETSKLKQLQPGLPDQFAWPFLPAWELGEGPCSAPRWSPSSHGSEIWVTISAPLQAVGLQDPFADPSTVPSPLHHKERESFHHLSKKSSNSTRPPTTHSQSCYRLPKGTWVPPIRQALLHACCWILFHREGLQAFSLHECHCKRPGAQS